MKKLILSFFIAFITVFFLSGCLYGANDLFYGGNFVHNRADELKILNEQNLQNLSSSYSFMVLTDVHVGAIRPDAPAPKNEKLFQWLESLSSDERPKFCLCLGDVADTGSSSQYEEYASFVRKIEDFGIKVYNCVGNHDLYQSGWNGWKSNCYPFTSFYKFETPGFSFYSLDTGSGEMGNRQLESFKRGLEQDSKPKLVFTHYPIYTPALFFNYSDTTERNLVLHYMAKNNVKLLLGGHLHYFEHYDLGSYQNYCIPSYRYKGQWALIDVDEKQQNYNLKIISADDIN